MPADSDATLNAIAAELSVVPPRDFVSARAARAKQIDDRALASEVKALRKPVLAAWAVNVLAQERRAELDRLLEVASALRDAQSALDARRLAELGRERRSVVEKLTELVSQLAEARGERLSPSTVEAARETLNAAVFDADAAAAVASGRLTRPLEASGGFSVDLEGAIAGGAADAPVSPPRKDSPRSAKESAAVARSRAKAERAVRAAEKDAAASARSLAEVTERRERAHEKAEALEERVEKLRQDLAAAERDLAEALERIDDLDAQVADAEKRDAEAQAVVDAARADLPE
ncbi:transposase [Microbacterium barkeri]|uniref:transposase n=1 Tax=Microbacterium barkeri TaxID=33917 RepID=UPI0024AFCBD5|nr:transposase [Microbacterium barkeri]MDI6942203.1 transposase [Microbacterium barkeri]